MLQKTSKKIKLGAAAALILLGMVVAIWFVMRANNVTEPPFTDADYRSMLVEATKLAESGKCSDAKALFARLETETTTVAYDKAEMSYRYGECLVATKEYQLGLPRLEEARANFEALGENKRVIMIRQVYDTAVAESLGGNK